MQHEMTEFNLNDATLSDGFIFQVEAAVINLLPAMIPDGGGVKLVEIRGTQVFLEFVGTCVYCPSQQLSASAFERNLIRLVPSISAINWVSFGAEHLVKIRS